MKILVVGSDKIYSIENFYVKYLRGSGMNVVHFPAQRIFYDYYQKSRWHKVLFRVGLSTIYRLINDALRVSIEVNRPSVVWIFKGMEIFPETLKWIRSQNIALVNYNPDNPFLFSGRGSGNRNISNGIACYDLHFTYNLKIKGQLINNYGACVSWLPFGYDVDDTVVVKCASSEEIHSTCFVGNPDKMRVGFIKALADRGIQVTLYGHDWNKFIIHPNITIEEAVYEEAQWMTLRKYRVQLNLLRIHNEDSHNMRTFEVPAIGGIMIAPDTVEHRMFFEPDNEVFLFNTVDECATKINALLKLSKVEADRIRERARSRSVRSGYSYESRTEQVVGELRKLMTRWPG